VALFLPDAAGGAAFVECPMSKVFAFLKNDSGATAIEYGLIAAGISIVIVASVDSVGSALNTTFSTFSTQLK
jgi:pilus assembly protein Flp/PilA